MVKPVTLAVDDLVSHAPVTRLIPSGASPFSRSPVRVEAAEMRFVVGLQGTSRKDWFACRTS